MNKVILMGRLTKDPEIRYSSGAQQTAVCRYTLAVNRSYKREGEPDADFINIVCFGARGEFAGKYFRKGMQIAVVGELRISSYDDRDGNRRWTTDVIASEQYFAEGKSNGAHETNAVEKAEKPASAPKKKVAQAEPVVEYEDDDLPF